MSSLSNRSLRWQVFSILIVASLVISGARIFSTTKLSAQEKWPKRPPPETPFLSANDTSRWITIYVLAEDGTYRLDEIIKLRGWSTIDIVKAPDGHYYASKPPLYSTIVAGFFWLLKNLCGYDLFEDIIPVVHWSLIVFNLLPFGISLFLLAWLAEQLAETDFAKIVIVASACLGTLLSTFQNTLNNHTPAAACLIISLASAWHIIHHEGKANSFLYLVTGFFAGWTMSFELPAAAWIMALSLVLSRKDLFRTLFLFLPVAALPMIAWEVNNYIVTGSLKPFYSGFGTELYVFSSEDGKPSYWSDPKGIDRGGDTPAMYLFHCTFGHHGIFSMTPIFLTTLLGWFRFCWSRSRPDRILSTITLVLTLLVLGFYMTKTESYNYGGVTWGLRWMFWMVPLWLLGMAPALDRLGNSSWFRWLVLFLLGSSILMVHLPGINPWKHPVYYQWCKTQGWLPAEQLE